MFSLDVKVVKDPELLLNVVELDDIGLDVDPLYESGGAQDYEKLENKPRLNGQTIIGDMVETDPTVPGWAKEQVKPRYTAEEIGGVDANSALSLEEIDELFKQVFNI